MRETVSLQISHYDANAATSVRLAALSAAAQANTRNAELAAPQENLTESYDDSFRRYDTFDHLATAERWVQLLGEFTETGGLREDYLHGCDAITAATAAGFTTFLTFCFFYAYHRSYAQEKAKQASESKSELELTLQALADELETLDEKTQHSQGITNWLNAKNKILTQIAAHSSHFESLKLVIEENQLRVVYKEKQPEKSRLDKFSDIMHTLTFILILPSLIFWIGYQFLTLFVPKDVLVAVEVLGINLSIAVPLIFTANYILRLAIDAINTHWKDDIYGWKPFYNAFFHEDKNSWFIPTAIRRFIGTVLIFPIYFIIAGIVSALYPKKLHQALEQDQNNEAEKVSIATQTHLKKAFETLKRVQKFQAQGNALGAAEEKLDEGPAPKRGIYEKFPQLKRKWFRTALYSFKFTFGTLANTCFASWFILHTLATYGVSMASEAALVTTVGSPLFITAIAVFGLILIASIVKTYAYHAKISGEYDKIAEAPEATQAPLVLEEKQHAPSAEANAQQPAKKPLFDRIFSAKNIATIGAIMTGGLIFRVVAVHGTSDFIPYKALTVDAIKNFFGLFSISASTLTAGIVLFGLVIGFGIAYMVMTRHTKSWDDATQTALQTSSDQLVLSALSGQPHSSDAPKPNIDPTPETDQNPDLRGNNGNGDGSQDARHWSPRMMDSSHANGDNGAPGTPANLSNLTDIPL